MNLKEAEIFLEEVKEIYSKVPKKEKTFMQISGYPHYENVCSNILAFYLNPKEEHKFNDVVLKTLLEMVREKNKEINTNVNLSNVNVFREYITENSNRIDIVLQNEDIVIGIENKIMARVYNDLNDYSKTLEKFNSNTVKILLSLNDESNVAIENEFVNITYTEFFQKLKERLVEYKDIQNKWYIYLIEFIKNLEGFELEKDMELKINEWIKEHQEDINSFYELLNIAKGSIEKKIKEYGTFLEEKIATNYKVGYWQDSDVQLGAYILLQSLGCNLDTIITANGWQIRLNIWKKMNRIKIKQALVENGYSVIEETDGYVYLYKLDYNYPINELVYKAKEILDLLRKIN